MTWNNGLEKKKFDIEQKRMADEYRRARMSEEQIKQIQQFDLNTFNSSRRYFEHTQQLTENMISENESFNFEDRYHWIEEIDDPELVSVIRKLSARDIEIITMYVYENYTHKEIAAAFGLTRSGVTKRFKRFREILKNFF